YIYKVFGNGAGGGKNFADPDVLFVTNTARRVMQEQLRMKQFIRFQKAKDGTYLAVVSPDYNVLPLIVDHFQDRFRDQPWLIYDAKRQYGYYYSLSPAGEGRGCNTQRQGKAMRITFPKDTTQPFNLDDGKLNEELLSENDKIFQKLWRTYFKAICIRERINPKKQLNDMPRRYWKYMTEKHM
ncbi:MAG: TIGR03915 family putative DNA repair protein, partial [Prevotella sp.]|nr:TIGR03915 family putative DNA repair protein [Prevotella sp.]